MEAHQFSTRPLYGGSTIRLLTYAFENGLSLPFYQKNEYHTHGMAQVLSRIHRYIPASLRPFGYAMKNQIPFPIGGNGGGETGNPRYCYSVWLRHLVYAHINGLPVDPTCIAELGPGDSLGIGLAAIISGVKRYYALDLIKHFNSAINTSIFDEIVHLYKQRTDIPGDTEFPNVYPKLKNYAFPDYILTEEWNKKSLSERRIHSIKRHLIDPVSSFDGGEGKIFFLAPWDDEKIIEKERVDMIISQAVLEHIDDLERAYSAMFQWLKPGGYMSHVIDFTSHNTSNIWNGHWAYSDFVWRLIRGRSPFLINRFPHSFHIQLMEHQGFLIIEDQITECKQGLERDNLVERFKKINDDDLKICGAFIQAQKPMGYYSWKEA
jgi:hypothetical protein